MEGQRFTKKDWTLFRQKLPGWQEAYMDRLTKEYIELLSGDAAASSKFWALEKRIKEDKRKAGVLLRISRSDLVDNIVELLHEEAIRFEDLAEFSQELRDAVSIIMRYSEQWQEH